jgi:hypothetical protein
MNNDQFDFQVKKKLSLFIGIFVVGIIAIAYFSCN